jgi:uncharacterized RmlC-like cupin family protein
MPKASNVRLALVLTITAFTLASASELQRRVGPAEIAGLAKEGAGAGTSHVGGIQSTVLSGDPSRPGLYTIRISVPANTTIKPHMHRDDRSATVVSGTWYFGYGTELSTSALKPLPAGSFYTEPAGTPHFAKTESEAVVVDITGYGPSDTKYVNAADSPTL